MAMKIKAPLPEAKELPGEEEENIAPVTSITERIRNKIHGHVNMAVVAQRMQALYGRGLSKRAVVAREFDDILNPESWGIIVDVNPTDEFPLIIAWCKQGLFTQSSGEGLTVIYAGITASDLKDLLDSKKAIIH